MTTVARLGRTSPRRTLVAMPPLLWLTTLVIAPVLLLLAYSTFQVRGGSIVAEPTAANFVQIIGDPLYVQLVSRSLLLAATVSMLAALIAFPLAALVASARPSIRLLLVTLVLVPLWVGFLVRILAWQALLGRGGVINSALLAAGLIDAPLDALLYSPVAVLVTLVYVNVPFVFIPVYVALERIPPGLRLAAHDLGAGDWATFRHIVMPLALPGLAVGMTFAFIEALGDYVTPTLVGGPTGVTIGRVIVNQFGVAFNWPLGSAMAVILLVVTLGILVVVGRLGGRQVFVE